ncbi:MAG: hypothetical protein ACK5LY_10815 [Lachnospirales bacterium]
MKVNTLLILIGSVIVFCLIIGLIIHRNGFKLFALVTDGEDRVYANFVALKGELTRQIDLDEGDVCTLYYAITENSGNVDIYLYDTLGDEMSVFYEGRDNYVFTADYTGIYPVTIVSEWASGEIDVYWRVVKASN